MKKAIRWVLIVSSLFFLYKCSQLSPFLASSKPVKVRGQSGEFAAPEFRRLNSQAYFFSSFVDLRDGNIGFPMVRTVALLSRAAAHEEFFCRFETAEKAKAHVYELSENHDQYFGAFFISCEFPDARNPPARFHLGSQNRLVELEVTYVIGGDRKTHRPASQFSICVPFLFGSFYTARDLIEFATLVKLVGAQKIFLYVDWPTLDTKIAETIEYFEDEGLVHAIQFKLPFPADLVWHYGQLATVSDCLYRNVGFSKYVAFHDIDEMLVPRTAEGGVADVLDAVGNSTIGSYRVPTAYFDTTDVIPPVRLNAHKYSRVDTLFTKCVLRPEMVFEQGIHHTSRLIQDHFQSVRISDSVLRLHHYKPSYRRTVDTVVSRKYGSAFLETYRRILDILGV